MSASQLATAASIHFRLWDAASRPYNLCQAFPWEPKRTTPTRSVVTCPACLERLR